MDGPAYSTAIGGSFVFGGSCHDLIMLIAVFVGEEVRNVSGGCGGCRQQQEEDEEEQVVVVVIEQGNWFLPFLADTSLQETRDITNCRAVGKSYDTTIVLRHIITTVLHVVATRDLDWPLRLSANGNLCSP